MTYSPWQISHISMAILRIVASSLHFGNILWAIQNGTVNLVESVPLILFATMQTLMTYIYCAAFSPKKFYIMAIAFLIATLLVIADIGIVSHYRQDIDMLNNSTKWTSDFRTYDYNIGFSVAKFILFAGFIAMMRL